MSASGDKNLHVPIASYLDNEQKLALALGKWYKHYKDALRILDRLYIGTHYYFVIRDPTDEELEKGRIDGKRRQEVALEIPVERIKVAAKLVKNKDGKVTSITEGAFIDKDTYEAARKMMYAFYLSRGRDDFQQVLPPAYRAAALANVAYLDENDMPHPRKEKGKVPRVTKEDEKI